MDSWGTWTREERIGFGVAVLTLLLVVVGFLSLYPLYQPLLQPKSPTPTPNRVGALEHTPQLGLQFWQEGQQVAMSLEKGSGFPDDVVDIPLKSSPFEIWFPSVGAQTAVQVCAWTDRSIFSIPAGGNVADSMLFGPGHGMADTAAGSGLILLNNEGDMYFIGSRIAPAASGFEKVYFSSIFGSDSGISDAPRPLSQQRAPIYLAIYIDKQANQQFNIGDYEYVALSFNP
jgi:hypothetical protein